MMDLNKKANDLQSKFLAEEKASDDALDARAKEEKSARVKPPTPPTDSPKAEPGPDGEDTTDPGTDPGTTAPAADGDDAASMVADAKASGKLKPIEDVMKEQGWDMDPGTALLLAQKKQAPGTQGKSPEELAQMLRADPSIYEELEALQPGGALDELETKGTSAMAEKRKAEPPPMM